VPSMRDDLGEYRASDNIAEYGGSQLLLSALRRSALDQACADLIRRDFAVAFPGDANEVFATFRAFLQALAHAGRRKLRVAYPCAKVLTPDETLLLAIVAAAQAGNEALFEAHLCWLALPKARDAVAITTRALAMALAAHNQWVQASICHSGAPHSGEPGTHEHELAGTGKKPVFMGPG
jgi:hypothetical protein